ncbi:MAG TPA: 7-cyano-7-deazaguanine synthase [Gemmataceae bacterium]|nr:7-cyano-7-deazaguanine synthase [Gemmataceae bacterium]
MTVSTELAVLFSGGLDSAVLVGEALRDHAAVHPLYVRSGLFWEEAELEFAERFLTAVRSPALRPLVVLEAPVTDVYGEHWSVRGRDVPDADTPDEAVYLPGRNVFLLGKSILWCHMHRVPAVALGTLAANPFPDATPEFIAGFGRLVNEAVGGSVWVLRPYVGLEKADVLQRGRDLPLELTLSCLRPVDGRHCGRCNKCEERRRAFADAGLTDRTPYGSG